MVAENKLLQAEISADEEQAGIDVFTKYGELNVLEGLSGGDITEWENVKGMPFEQVLIKRRMNNDKNEYEKRLREIISKGK